MTSKEALQNLRFDVSMSQDINYIEANNECDIIEKDLEVLEIFKNCFVIINDELMFSISPKQEEKIKRWLEKNE